MFKDVGTQHRADDDTAKAIEIVNGYGGCKKAVVGSYTSHHHIANQKISLSHRHIMLFSRLTLDEVKYGRWALHAEEATHQPAQCSCAYLHPLRRRQFYALTKQHEVNTNQDECHTKDAVQDIVFDARQCKDGDGRDDDKRQQNRPKPLPSDVASQPPYDNCRSGDSQQSWECRSLSIAWHEERQHRHDEDAKTEARGALDETRADAQQEYGEDDATQILVILKNRHKFTQKSPYSTQNN